MQPAAPSRNAVTNTRELNGRRRQESKSVDARAQGARPEASMNGRDAPRLHGAGQPAAQLTAAAAEKGTAAAAAGAQVTNGVTAQAVRCLSAAAQ